MPGRGKPSRKQLDLKTFEAKVKVGARSLGFLATNLFCPKTIGFLSRAENGQPLVEVKPMAVYVTPLG